MDRQAVEAARLAAVAAKALEFKAMAERELQGQPLTVQEEASLRGFGGYLEEVVIWANGDKPEPDPAAIIADVATDPNKGEVLEVGIGNVHELYAVAPIPQADGSLALTVARGAIFSYYEFPSQKRLTDEAWRAMLKARQTPEQPAFITGFSVPQPSSPNIQTAIYRFQRDWANWLYWTVGYNGTEGCSVGPQFIVPVGAAVLRQAEAAVAALQAHPWPGNIRELRNVITAAIVRCGGPPVDLKRLFGRRTISELHSKRGRHRARDLVGLPGDLHRQRSVYLVRSEPAGACRCPPRPVYCGCLL